MKENSGLSEAQMTLLDMNCLSDQEVKLLRMFRVVNVQKRVDILRIIEVFMLGAEQ